MEIRRRERRGPVVTVAVAVALFAVWFAVGLGAMWVISRAAP